MRNSYPLVSVIVPVYNVQEYLRECLDSIINQSYRNLEIIIIDDGSTDESGSIADEYGDKDARILVFHTENKGSSEARNKGMDYVNGQYVQFVDSDDYIEIDMVDILLRTLLESNCDVAECRFTRKMSREESSFEVKTLSTNEAVSKLISSEYNYPSDSVWNKLFRTDIVKELRFPEGKIHEEYLFLSKAFYQSSLYGFVDAELYHYRLREGSITNVIFSDKDMAQLEIYKKRTEYFERINECELAKLARTEEFLILFSFYWKMKKQGMLEYVSIGEEIKERKKELLRCRLPLKRKLVYALYYINPNIYLIVRDGINKILGY